MIKITRLLLGALSALLFLSTPLQAEEKFGVPYTRIYTDAQGESHFEDGFLRLNEVDLQSGDISAGMMNLQVSNQALLMMLQPGAEEDWHPTPSAQYLVVIQGISEVGVSDGEVRQFGPGSLVLMDDATGKGHTTKTVGDEDHIALLIPKE